jgi:methylated-DNA-[protein]-cysteine S-methyltransferase
MIYAIYESRLGPILAARDNNGIRLVNFKIKGNDFNIPPDWRQDPQAMSDVFQQLEEYFAGDRQTFDLPLAPGGTPFMKRCWDFLLTIPYGQTTTYQTIARALGNPNASRAVGLANARNPIHIIIPCHRVIGANSHLTGYAGGLPIKQKLLELEGASTFKRLFHDINQILRLI